MVEVDVRDKGFSKKPLLEDSINRMKEVLSYLPTHEVDLRTVSSITGLILANDVIAQVNIPNFNRSMMDGYAAIFEDVKDASEFNPIIITVIAENYMGNITKSIEPKTVIKVPTGGMVPESADIVIKIEDTEIIESENKVKSIKVKKSFELGKNISPIGDDFKAGEVVLTKNSRLVFTDIGVILSVGVFTITCYKNPKIAIFPTGDEIVDTNDQLKPGQVYDSTTYIIKEICTQLGFDLTRYSKVKDEKQLIINRLNELTIDFDVILMTGGTSVGNKDYSPIIIDEIGELYVHGASVRPGSPITAGIISDKLVIGLPGFPVSTISSFLFFVLPLLFYKLGDYKFSYPTVNAVLTHKMKSKVGRRDFMRIRLEKDREGNFIATPIMIAGSSLLRTINKANGIVIINEDQTEVNIDQKVEVIPFDWLGKF